MQTSPLNSTGWLTRWLLRRTLGAAHPSTPDSRTRLGILEGWISTGLSLVLFLIKAITGWISGSISLMADATNNLTDIGSSLVIALGFHWSRKPQDPEHPFGHGRIEQVSALVLSIAFFLVGFEVIRSGIVRLIHPQPVQVGPVLLAVITGTVVIKLWLARFARKLAQLTGSAVLQADAWNHTFDIASTLLVLLALVCSRLGWSTVDGAAAVAVGLFIVGLGVKYARETIGTILGEAPPAEEAEKVHRVIESVPGVLSVHDMIIHRYGDVKLVSFHIEVCGRQTAYETHDLAEQAEAAVEQLGYRAIAHVDPVNRSHPEYTRFFEALAELIHHDNRLLGFHDLRILTSPEGMKLSLDLVARITLPRAVRKTLLEEMAIRIFEQHADVHTLELGVETELASDPTFRRRFTRPAL